LREDARRQKKLERIAREYKTPIVQDVEFDDDAPVKRKNKKKHLRRVHNQTGTY
jgi:hypothetical protein